MERRAVRALVSGRVQGVGFRWFVQRQAERLRIHGTVRNCDDGTVEVVAVAPTAALREFLAAVSRGPAGARVDAVRQEDLDALPDSEGFHITG